MNYEKELCKNCNKSTNDIIELGAYCCELQKKLKEKNNGEVLNFDRKCKCDWCGQVEICSITHYGTTNYTRLICLECALSITQNDKPFRNTDYFNLQDSHIRFRDFVYDCTKEDNDIEKRDEEEV
jgi:hypothetical protein